MEQSKFLRLGLNVDHVATVRNARGGFYPDPIAVAKLAAEAGVDNITAHLREDRRHINENDVERLLKEVDLPLNLEIAASAEMVNYALDQKPHAVCLVPERREEKTTEGGLDLLKNKTNLFSLIDSLKQQEIKTSCFVEADRRQIDCAKELGADAIEIHTGAYCLAEGEKQHFELQKIKTAAFHADNIGIECHAGHGLDYQTVGAVAAIMPIEELNIGHFLIGDAIGVGIDVAIKKMRACMNQARSDSKTSTTKKLVQIRL